MSEFLIVGGGVIGLSVAWELAGRGKRVTIVDRRQPGRATSWVGVGILPPPLAKATHDPLEQLRTASHELHVEWSERLLAETGIDNELRECGGIYFARSKAEAASLRVATQQAESEGVLANELSMEQLVKLEPELESIADQVSLAYHLPKEMQLRSPRHLKALIRGCEQRGVQFRANVDVQRTLVENGRVTGLESSAGVLTADEYIFCGGTWSASLLEPLGISLPIEPWRGQLLLWKTERPLFRNVINEGLRYLVPRLDGHLIVGATVEDVGFDASTTEEATAELMAYSRSVVPELSDAEIVDTWAGLRPKTPDGLPFMGRVPGLDNLTVAAGHFRSGLHLAPVTAVFMTRLLLDDAASLDTEAFRILR